MLQSNIQFLSFKSFFLWNLCSWGFTIDQLPTINYT